jgi:hypothetical protein
MRFKICVSQDFDYADLRHRMLKAIPDRLTQAPDISMKTRFPYARRKDRVETGAIKIPSVLGNEQPDVARLPRLRTQRM